VIKSLPAQITTITSQITPPVTTRNLRFLVGFAIFLVLIVGVYSIIFHEIMAMEGQNYSWLSGVYWTLVTMSTLGLGDITFQSDIGRAFSVIVLVSGMLLLLVLLPFTFIEFFYSPFVRAQQEARAPRSVPQGMRGHVILTHYDAVTAALIRKLEKYKTDYVLVVKAVEEALTLHDMGVRVVVADLGEPESFKRCGFGGAGMVAATGDDFVNTGIVFTARQMSDTAVIVATAGSPDSVDVLMLAGCSHVMQLAEQMGAALARRTVAADAQAHVIGSFDDLRIAEAIVAGTPLQGKTLSEIRIRELAGLNVIGLWHRGFFREADPTIALTSDTLLLLAGTDEQLDAYNALFCIYNQAHAPCVIIGGGRIGRSAARAFQALDLDYRIVEAAPDRVHDPERTILGNAADRASLVKAGIEEAPAVLITPQDDDISIYLTIYCRKLRPDIQILTRANSEANVKRLHAAGADIVMSYASMGSNTIFNLLRDEKSLLIAEGLNVFRAKVPTTLENVRIRECGIRPRTGCTIIATGRDNNRTLNPPPETPLNPGDELLLVGTIEGEEKFVEAFGG
jgi:voltage-gated potassium channel